jgi:hypothetical protein
LTIYQVQTLKHLKNYTHRWFKKAVLANTLLVALVACTDPATQIGQEILNGGNLISTQYTDTLTLATSTVQLDSVVSSSTDHLLVGRYYDPIFGWVKAKSFFQIANIDTLRNTKDAILDSVVLSLGYKYYHGDTLKPQSIAVHRVTEKIGQNTGNLTKRLLESLDSRNTYFVKDAVKYESQPLGEVKNFMARPVRLRNKTNAEFDSLFSSLNIRLKPEFGNELMQLQGKKAGSGLVDFKEYLKGLVLVPGETDNAAILGFEPNNTPSTIALRPSYLGLYYHSKEKKDTLSTFFLVSFTTNTAFNNRFNQLEVDRTGTNLALLKKANERIPAVGSEKEVYLQSSTGVGIKVDMPYLKNLTKNGNVAINKVELILKPVKLYNGQLPSIGINMINVNPLDNTKPWRTATGELLSVPAEGGTTGQLAVYNTITKSYAFNITSYVQNVLSGKISNTGFLLNAIQDNRVNRLVLDKTTIKLRVYYTQLGK